MRQSRAENARESNEKLVGKGNSAKTNERTIIVITSTHTKSIIPASHHQRRFRKVTLQSVTLIIPTRILHCWEVLRIPLSSHFLSGSRAKKRRILTTAGICVPKQHHHQVSLPIWRLGWPTPIFGPYFTYRNLVTTSFEWKIMTRRKERMFF